MSNTRYIFLPLFRYQCFSQVATNFTFTSKTSLVLLFFKCLPSNATKKSLVKSVEPKLEEAFSDVIWDVQLGWFILLSVPISQQLFQTYLALLLLFSQLAIETWLHISLTRFRGFWTFIHSWKLEATPLQVTKYNASFLNFSPKLSTH